MAFVSKTKIANLAFGHLHERHTIANIETDTSAPGTLANLWYDIARQEVLEAANWTFARGSLLLAAHNEDAPEDRWAYRYQFPADALISRYLENPGGPDADAVPFDEERSPDGSKCVLTDLSEATLVYTRDEKNTGLFSAHFIIALSYRLAWYCPSITTKQKLVDSIHAKYMDAVLSAGAIDANKTVSRPPRDAGHIRGR